MINRSCFAVIYILQLKRAHSRKCRSLWVQKKIIKLIHNEEIAPLRQHASVNKLLNGVDSIWHRELVKCYIWSTALYGAETWTLGREIKNTWEASKCGTISWSDRVRNVVLHRVKEKRNILQTINKKEY